MNTIRRETQNSYTDKELLNLIKECLDDLDIVYEEKPGGFDVDKMLDPNILFKSTEMED